MSAYRHKRDFIDFCSSYKIDPQIGRLFPYQRLGTPFGSQALIDTQFYIGMSEQNIDSTLNQVQWASPAQYLQLYENGDLQLCSNTVVLLHILSLVPNYRALEQMRQENLKL